MGLRLIGARESIDKEKYIYDHVSGETIVIVPNQYTLVAEEQALKHLGKDCLYDVEILSMNRLGNRILMEQGLENVPMLDKYGRFMLLSRIIRQHKDDLTVFKLAAEKRSFVSMVNNFISDLKQQDCSIEDLNEMIASGKAGELLINKLRELELITKAYEEEIAGKYTDSEDHVSMYVDAISRSELIKDKEFWVYGYDSITPRFRNAVVELAAHSRGVNFIVNRSDQGLDKMLSAMLAKESEKRCVDIEFADIPGGPAETGGYDLEKAETLKRIERDLFAGRRDPDFEPVGLEIVECANPYYEAESAAAYIHGLLRDEGYRMRDITIVANDEDGMQPKVSRMFEEYGLPVFVDTRKGIGDTPVASFVVSLLEFVNYRYRTGAMLILLKSGLAGFSRESVEEFENYVVGYKVKGSMWAKPFKYGSHEYNERIFAKLEKMRANVMGRIAGFEAMLKDRDENSGEEAHKVTVREFTTAFYKYLNDEWDLRSRVEALAAEQAAEGLLGESQRTAQSYDAVMRILDQVVEILGDEEMKLDEFLQIFTEGIGSVDVGIIPPAADGLTMGTMIRTRPAPVKAVIILGANEGVLPMEPSPEGLFSVDEKSYFRNEAGFPLGALDDIKMLEENVAMYRMMSKAASKVYVSYSMTDGAGSDMKPSPLIDTIKTVFPKVLVRKDIVSDGFTMALVNDKKETLRHLINHIKDASADSGDLAHAVMGWYESNAPEMLEPMLQASRSENEALPLSKELAKRLYSRANGEFNFSSSRLEQHNHCPFRHFVSFGLHPKEEREFTGDARSIGDVYHECIMRVSRRLMAAADGDALTEAEPGHRLIDTITDEELDKMVEEELFNMASEYRGGLFVSTSREKYRIERIATICTDAVRVMAEQIRKGDLEEAFFEEQFGPGKRFRPLEYEVDGERVIITGKIDRVDVLTGGKARIIDYKTGSDKLDIEKMRSGYKMQLMVYLEGAVSGEYEPAGMFYFNINEDIASAGSWKAGKLEKEIEKLEDNRFSLKGAYIDDKSILEKMPLDVISSESKKLSREDFEQLEADVRQTIGDISKRIVSGDIRIEPAVVKTGTGSIQEKACTYCNYRAICRFDRTYRKNRYRNVK